MMRRPPGSPLFPNTTPSRPLAALPARPALARWNGAPAPRVAMALTPAAVAPTEQSAADEVISLQDLSPEAADRKSTRLNSSHANISYAVFCLKKKIVEGEQQ